MRAVMLSPAGREGEVGGEEETEMRFSPEGAGARVMSMSCHQSSSTVLFTPLFWNHWAGGQPISNSSSVSTGLTFLSPKGTANNTFGCVS